MTELLQVFILQQHHIRIDAIRLPHTNRCFVVEPQIFLSGSNRVKICRDISLPNLLLRAFTLGWSLPHTSRFFLLRLTPFRLGAESISATL